MWPGAEFVNRASKSATNLLPSDSLTSNMIVDTLHWPTGWNCQACNPASLVQVVLPNRREGANHGNSSTSFSNGRVASAWLNWLLRDSSGSIRIDGDRLPEGAKSAKGGHRPRGAGFGNWNADDLHKLRDKAVIRRQRFFAICLACGSPKLWPTLKSMT